MITRIGVIAEEDSDIDVVDELIHKILPQKKYSIKSFVGHGCGKIRGKCFQWAKVLKTRGCSTLILLHDLDENIFMELYDQLNKALINCSIPKNIVRLHCKKVFRDSQKRKSLI
jgi:hypothetical protein